MADTLQEGRRWLQDVLHDAPIQIRAWQPRRIMHYAMGTKTNVQPRPQSSLLGRTVDGAEVGFDAGTYLTPTRIVDNQAAQGFLALSYAPLHRYVCDVDGVPIPQRFRDGFGTPNEWSRIWPAYGQPGGALETVLVDGIISDLHHDEQWPKGGGRFDMDGLRTEFHGLKQGFDAAVNAARVPFADDIVPPDDETPEDLERGGQYAAYRGGALTGAVVRRSHGVSVSLGRLRSSEEPTYRLWSAAWYDHAPLRVLLDLGHVDIQPEDWQLGGGGSFIDARAVEKSVADQIQRADRQRGNLERGGRLVWMPPPYKPSELML